MPNETEPISLESLIRAMSKGLHDMAQPLTTLQCRLYLGTLEEDPKALKAVVADGVMECEQVMAWVHRLQVQLEQFRMEQAKNELGG